MSWRGDHTGAHCTVCNYFVFPVDRTRLGDRCPLCEGVKCGMVTIPDEAEEEEARRWLEANAPAMLRFYSSGPRKCGEYYCPEHRHPAWAFGGVGV